MSMKSDWLKKHWNKIVWPAVLIIAGTAGWFTRDQWMPFAERFVAFIKNEKESDEDEEDEAPPSETPDTLTLSPQAWRNIGLEVDTVVPTDFVKIVSVPAIVVERPGRSQIEIAAPMTGIVTQVYPLEREGVRPGQPLFDLRLTHEDVVSSQSEFLSKLQTLDVVEKELARLRNIGEGVIPGKRIIEQEYKRDEVTATIETLRQSLVLHGMSKEQVEEIERSRQVLKNITVTAPPFAQNHVSDTTSCQYHVQSININRGESVEAGDLLGVLADHCLLYVEGRGFDDDTKRLVAACQYGNTVDVVPVSNSSQNEEQLSLKVQSVADKIDGQSRALRFYLSLPNQLLRGEDIESTNDFVAWKYRPGQRMEARIPTSDVLKNKIVLPADAVVIEGPNAFVFEQNGDNFDRIDVEVLYRDKDTVVLENDGQLVGSILAMNGAYQMHLALKNQSGGAIDPHAGHNH